MIIRPIEYQDLPALRAIARESGPGFTSLVDDPEYLDSKLRHTIDSFQRKLYQPGDEHYLFVLEDETTGDIMGTTGIEASAGHDRPLCHFRRETDPASLSGSERLTRCSHYTGCTEICSLYLRPRYRRANAGKLLSKVRFLFMAQNPHRFSATIIAEMRGVSDANGQSPFWNWLKTRAGNLDFATVTRLAGTATPELLDTLLPDGPLPMAAMPPAARQVIGQVHEQTRPALKMLIAEGFRHTGFVDLFDAGPTVEAQLHEITSIRRSSLCRVQVVDDSMPAITRNQTGNRDNAMLIANTAVSDFRATITHAAAWLPHHNLLSVPASLARKLGLSDGSMTRFLSLAAIGKAETTIHPNSPEVLYAH
ncbi:arginine N-succinyltransferase [Marinobacter sp. NP-4(2019)]|uniref:arginine N-succinyltransferase n=1 Tax=Marinobacter sp. NP-4(2019) TaxID=2488665 RepID=UPI000FC3CAE3|nr:arginine N-succinyltransferase [Marinobacter sp. NP-4(2019)]AZT84760.1 arginine N-succinyltransferase [Marinobacter sp. NP-4(2019)]